MKLRSGLLAFALVFLFCGSAPAQFHKLKSLGKKAIEKAVTNNEEPPPDSQPEGKANPDNGASPASNKATPVASAPAQSAGAAPAQGGQPNLVSVPIDFIPGEKTVFYDDFSDMPPGEPPPHWQVRGGRVDLLMGGGVRALSIPAGVNLTSGSLQVPKDFTFQVVLKPSPEFNDGSGFLTFSFRNKDDDEVIGGEINVKYGSISLTNDLGSADTKWDPSKPNEYDFWAQQGRVRAYVNGKRLIDVNQVKIGPIDHLYLEESQGTFQLRSVRVAESAPDPGSVLMTTGKLVTHGIYFDTNSDVLKPESAPVIKGISNALYKNPGMKVEIDGYTDSTGDAAKNLDLSKRRAAAVMKVLVTQFGIDQSRLTSNGFGAASPIASNDTPDGRAQNRRVEFVRQGAHASAPTPSGGGAGAEASASPGKCAPLAIPAGTRLFPAYQSGSKNYVKLKPEEQVAYLMLLSIRKLEERCDRELNRACTLAELVQGVQGSKSAFNGPVIGLDIDPACDTHYRYAVAKVMGGWRLTIEPLAAGLGGFLDDEGAPLGL